MLGVEYVLRIGLRIPCLLPTQEANFFNMLEALLKKVNKRGNIGDKNNDAFVFLCGIRVRKIEFSGIIIESEF